MRIVDYDEFKRILIDSHVDVIPADGSIYDFQAKITGKETFENVRVHYDERKIEFPALAYTAGTNVYFSPKVGEHVMHETFHVIQQCPRGVQPISAVGTQIELMADDEVIAKEADRHS